MRFDSNSVFMRQGMSRHYIIDRPPCFREYKFNNDVFKNAVEAFNRKLNERKCVTRFIGDIFIDILRVELVPPDVLTLWVVVHENDIDILSKKCFTIKGDIYFADNSDSKVDHMVFNDVMFDSENGIFTK